MAAHGARDVRRSRARPDAARTWTGSTSAARSAPAPIRRSSCSPRAATRWTASSGSKWAPTTICRSRSSRANCWRGSRRSCAAARGERGSRCAALRAAGDRPRRTRRAARWRGAALTSHQFDLLLVLARRAGRVLTRDAIMDELKSENLEAFDRSIDVHVSRIRAAYRGRCEEPAPGHHGARRRLCLRQGAGLIAAMLRLYQRSI